MAATGRMLDLTETDEGMEHQRCPESCIKKREEHGSFDVRFAISEIAQKVNEQPCQSHQKPPHERVVDPAPQTEKTPAAQPDMRIQGEIDCAIPLHREQ